MEMTDRIQGRMTELRSRRMKIINEDENEACIEELRKLKRILDECPKNIAVMNMALFDKIIECLYAEEDGDVTFKLIGGLEFKMNIRDKRNEEQDL
jgi:hypothetical protein